MIIAAVTVTLVATVLARRVPWVRDRLPPPAVALLLAGAGTVVLFVLADWPAGAPRTLAAGSATAVLGAVGILVAGWCRQLVIDPLRLRAQRSTAPPLRDRVVARADAVSWRVHGWNPVALTVRAALRSSDVRVTGLAAEMSYYALISLVPITTALGSSLGYLRRILGDEQVEEIRTSIVNALTTVFAEQVASDVLAPLVDGLLSEERTGFAVGALLLTLYLASRMFRAVVRALDDAYRVATRRHVVAQYALGIVFTIGALAALVAILLLLVVGPLLGSGEELAEQLGLGDAFAVGWHVLRWPVALVLVALFLLLLYRYAPNVENTWSRCLPGAILGTVGVVLVSAGFQLYVRFASPAGLEVDAGTGAVVQAAAQMLSLVLAGVLWIWLASIAVLAGGILNAEIDEERRTSGGEAPARDVDEVSDAEPRRSP